MISARKTFVSLWVVALALFASLNAHRANAQTMYSGDTTGGPTFNRPLAGAPPAGLSGVGTAVPYHTYSYTPTVTGTYSFFCQSDGGQDPFLCLYQTSFSAADPLTNCLVTNDDITTGNYLQSGFTANLTAGTTYIVVTTGFGNTDFGPFTNTIATLESATATGTTSGAPAYNRPNVGAPPTTLSGIGTAVPYSVLTVTVATTGNYNFTARRTTDEYDPFTALHATSFDPNNPLANIILSNDDKAGNVNFDISGFDGVALMTGVEYKLVVSGYDNEDFGDYEVLITGPGAITISTGGRTISGTIAMEDCPAGLPFEASFVLRPSDNSGDITINTTVNAAGQYELKNLPSKDFQIKAKTSRSISKVRSANVTSGNVSGLAFGALKGGDAFEDNSIDVLDLDALIQAFDSDPFAPNWNANADFDCSDSVDVLDLDVLLRNFDQVGEDFPGGPPI